MFLFVCGRYGGVNGLCKGSSIIVIIFTGVKGDSTLF